MIAQPLFKIGDLVQKRNDYFVIYDQRGNLIPACPGLVVEIKKDIAPTAHQRRQYPLWDLLARGCSYVVLIEESTYLIEEDILQYV